jgi:L-lactate dehydrogenase (cytochrome)
LPRPLFGYVEGSVEDGVAALNNRRIFSTYGFKTRALRDVSTRDQSIVLFGKRYASPIGIAPMGISALTAYRGDLVLAQAAQATGIPCIMSGSSLIRLEEVMAAAPSTWFQAYLPGKPEQMHALVDRVRNAGVETLVITVDTPVMANRENNIRSGFSTPLKFNLSLAYQGLSHPRWLIGTLLRTVLRHGMPHFENNYAHRGAPILSNAVSRDLHERSHVTWEHISEIRKRWSGVLIIKGVLDARDALLAQKIGAEGIIVSNHGGRQLDGTVSPMQVLPHIMDNAGHMTVMIDSGIRRGTDVLKAVALGARCAFIGRPFNYAAAIAGEAGVEHGIELLATEISRNMGMLGVTRIQDITHEFLMAMPILHNSPPRSEATK